MTAPEIVEIIKATGSIVTTLLLPVIAVVIPYMLRKMEERSAARTAALAVTSGAHYAEQKAAMAKTQDTVKILEENTNSKMDQLLKLKGESEHEKGRKQGAEEGVITSIQIEGPSGPPGPPGPQGEKGEQGKKGSLFG